MPLVEDFCTHFHLAVEDPQEETVQPANAAQLIDSWRKHNTWAVGAMSTGMEADKPELHYLPAKSATAWWRYMRVKQEIEDSLTEDIFVPSLLILMNPKKQLFSMMVWPKGIAQFFPQCDYVFMARDKKRLFGTKEETGLVAYDAVIASIGHLLDDYEFGGNQFKYLRPGKESRVVPLIQTLALESVDLSQYTRMGPDSFHDVDLAAK